MFEVLERLLLGRSRIKKGWVQGKYRTGEGYCALGGIRNENHAKDRVFYKCNNILTIKLRDKRYNGFIHWFNDERGRKKEEILTLYDKAIESEVERVGVSVEKLNI